jgi:hypothetical protein
MLRPASALIAGLILTGWVLPPAARAQTINASSDPNELPTFTLHPEQGGLFIINEDVALDIASGPWIKELRNGDNPHSSGQGVPIIETFHNVGNLPWTDWHERIITRTSIQQPDDAPGFVFAENSVVLEADYGNGFVPLSQGVDYQLVTEPYAGPAFGGNFPHWVAIDIFFEPHAAIQPGDSLIIGKQIHEVFGDANIWEPLEIVQIEQYPTPEPTSLALCALGAALMPRRRRASL